MEPGRSELGAYGHGPAAEELCARLVATVQAWSSDRGEDLHITAAPREAADSGQTEALGRTVTKRHITMVLT